jgi:RNA-binding protein YhbY
MPNRRNQIMQIQIGKNGLTEGVIEQIKKLFKDEEIMKVSILKSACRDKDQAKEIADKIIEALGKNYVYKLVGYVLTINKFRREIRS